MSSLEIIKTISIILFPGILTVFMATGIVYFQKDKIYRYPSNEWLDLKEHPIPEDIRGFIGTDGKKVDYIYSFTWGPYGKIIFSNYDKTFLTHWQPLPDIPKKETRYEK